MVHAKQSYLNRDYSVLEQKGRHTIVSYIFKLIILLFGSIMMFDSGMFLLCFDTRLHWLITPGLMPSNTYPL